MFYGNLLLTSNHWLSVEWFSPSCVQKGSSICWKLLRYPSSSYHRSSQWKLEATQKLWYDQKQKIVLVFKLLLTCTAKNVSRYFPVLWQCLLKRPYQKSLHQRLENDKQAVPICDRTVSNVLYVHHVLCFFLNKLPLDFLAWLWRKSSSQLDILNTDFHYHWVVQWEIAKWCCANYSSTARPVSMTICHLLYKQ